MSHRTPTSAAPVLGSRPSETGSAYLVAILALVVLTIAGLALALITQTEMQIGANEKMIERAFYAADSGISVSTSRALVARGGAEGTQLVLSDPEGYGLRLEQRVLVSPFFPISDGFCFLSDIANQGQYGDLSFRRVNHAVTSTAMRRVPGSDAPLAERSVTAMMEFQCIRFRPDAVKAVFEPELLDQIEF